MTRFTAALFGLALCVLTQASPAANYSDWWTDPAYAGSSTTISQQGNVLGLGWYFYDTSGNPTWIYGFGNLSGTTATLPLNAATGTTLGAPASVTPVSTGTATITFTSDSTATLVYTYSGTSAYAGRSGQLSLQRFTMTPLPIAGTYKYAAKVVLSECTSPASNSTSYPFGTLVITASGGSIAVSNHVSTGNVCDYTAPYVQYGSMISTDGSYTCTNGAYGNGHFDFALAGDAIEVTATGQQTTGGSTCQQSILRSGVRQ